jgi:cyclic beta-1,2-glucan synthetase
MTLTLRGTTLTLRHGTPPGAAPRTPTRHAASGEWIDWHTLPADALVQVG